MTIIVTDGKTMAADSMAVSGARRLQSAHPKITRSPDGSLRHRRGLLGLRGMGEERLFGA